MKNNMKIKFQNIVPTDVCLALSGGADSMSALHILLRFKKNVKVLHFNHGTEISLSSEQLVTRYCVQHGIDFKIGRIKDPVIPHGRSKEDYWRECRYKFFDENSGGMPIVTAHHLDDQVESFLMSTIMTGTPKLIPVIRDKFIRPFVLCTKASLLNYAERNSIPFIHDPSNDDVKFMRNFTRHELVPVAMKLNPGLARTVTKKILADNPILGL